MYLFIVAAVVAVTVVEEMCLGWIHRTVMLAVNFLALSPRSPKIVARLEEAKQDVTNAYTKRDTARQVTKYDGGFIYCRAQRRLDAAWERLTHLGGVAFFCGAPVDRKLQTKGGRLRVEIMLCLAAMLFAASAMAVEPVFASSSSTTFEFFHPIFGCFLSMPEGAEKQCEIEVLRHWEGLSFGEKMKHALVGTAIWRSIPIVERMKVNVIWMLVFVSFLGSFGLLFWRFLR